VGPNGARTGATVRHHQAVNENGSPRRGLVTAALVVVIAAGTAVLLALGALGWRTMSADRAQASAFASASAASASISEAKSAYRLVRLDPWPFASGEASQKTTDCDRMRYMATQATWVLVDEADGRIGSNYITQGLTAEDCGVVVDRSKKIDT
jgi:hypothetical protein